jgi:hypothetical protein
VFDVTPVVAAATKAVVASCVVLVPNAAVGAAGTPVNVGDALKTTDPVPVSSVTAVARFELEGVARNAPTPVPRPVIEPTATVGAAHVLSPYRIVPLFAVPEPRRAVGTVPLDRSFALPVDAIGKSALVTVIRFDSDVLIASITF